MVSGQRARDVTRVLASVVDAYVGRRLGVAILLVVGAATLSASAPVALKLLVDDLSGRGTPSFAARSLGLVAAYVAAQWLARIMTEARSLVFNGAERRVYRLLSQRLFSHLMNLPLRFHLERQTGALTQTLANGLHGYQVLLQHLVFTFLPVAAELLVVVTVLVQFGHASVIPMLAVAMTAYAVAFAVGIARLSEPARAISAAHIDANAVLTDSILNYEAVKAFTAESTVLNRYDRALSQVERHWRRYFGRKTASGACIATIFAVSLGVSIAYAAVQVAHGTMTLGDFVLVNAYFLQLARPIEQLGIAVQDLSRGLAFADNLLQLLRLAPEAKGDDIGVPVPCQGELEFDSVCFAYAPGRPVLRDVSFVVRAGRSLGIVGASGAGKSSLLRLVLRFHEPESGQIRLDGRPIKDFPLSQLRQAIAVVPQDPALFHDTVAYNISFGKDGSAPHDIERAARIAHLHEFLVTLSEGYDTVVGERGIRLSGGEKQRVAIARAAIKDPRIFVFDEATSSLDSKTELEIMRNLREISCGRTTLIIAHRLSTVQHARRDSRASRGRNRGTRDARRAATSTRLLRRNVAGTT